MARSKSDKKQNQAIKAATKQAAGEVKGTPEIDPAGGRKAKRAASPASKKLFVAAATAVGTAVARRGLEGLWRISGRKLPTTRDQGSAAEKVVWAAAMAAALAGSRTLVDQSATRSWTRAHKEQDAVDAARQVQIDGPKRRRRSKT